MSATARKSLLILTSRQNFVWTSMEEVIPWIEKTWQGWSSENQIECQMLNIDGLSFQEVLQAALKSDVVLVTCFTVKMASYVMALRGRAHVDAPIYFYLHSQATIACWPLFKWQMAQVMRTDDVLIGSCRRDLKHLDLTFQNHSSAIIPFSLMDLSFLKDQKTQIGSTRKLAFVGRISTQKNLHTLLWSLSKLVGRADLPNWEMHIFGKEDFLGSPLMGMAQENYHDYLLSLSKKLNLQDRVKFHGFLPREQITEMLSKEQWILVSPSIHSDENFGMAAYRGLVAGHLSVLTDWGGHADLKENFPKQVFAVPVCSSPEGPYVEVSELAEQLGQAILCRETFAVNVPAHYQTSSVYEKISQVWNQSRSSAPLLARPVVEKILAKQAFYYEKQKQSSESIPENRLGCQIYEGYNDPTATPFFEAYGATKPKSAPGSHLAPWVTYDSEKYRIDDPHRGKKLFSESEFSSLPNFAGWKGH